MSFLSSLDNTLFLAINQSFIHPIFDALMIAITYLGRFPTLFIPLWFILYWKGDAKTKKVCWLLIPLLLMSDMIPTYVLKPFFARYRPFLEIEATRLILDVHSHTSPYGFPSNHASNIWALFTFLSLNYLKNKKSLIYLFIPFVVCYSRVYIGVHYPGDVLAGTLFGIFIGTGVYFTGKRLLYLK